MREPAPEPSPVSMPEPWSVREPGPNNSATSNTEYIDDAGENGAQDNLGTFDGLDVIDEVDEQYDLELDVGDFDFYGFDDLDDPEEENASESDATTPLGRRRELAPERVYPASQGFYSGKPAKEETSGFFERGSEAPEATSSADIDPSTGDTFDLAVGQYRLEASASTFEPMPRQVPEPHGFGPEHVSGTEYASGPEHASEHEFEQNHEPARPSEPEPLPVMRPCAQTPREPVRQHTVVRKHRSCSLVPVAVAGACVVAALVFAYGAGAWYFSSHLLPNTRVGGLDVSGLSAGDATDALRAQTRDYACQVSTADLTLDIAGSDVSLSRDDERIVREAMRSQDALAWPLAFVSSANVETTDEVALDEAQLRDIVGRAVDERNTREAVADRLVRLDGDSGLYVVAESNATLVDANAVADRAAASMRALDKTCIVSPEEATRQAAPDQESQLAATVAAVNASRTSDIAILLYGRVVLVSGAAQNAQWVWIDDAGQVAVDADAVRTWAEQVVFPSVDHTDWVYDYYLDVDAFVNEFCARLREGRTDGYEVPLTVVAQRGSAETGTTYAASYDGGSYDDYGWSDDYYYGYGYGYGDDYYYGY